MHYKDNKGAYKVSESVSLLSHYGAVVIFNYSNKPLTEEFIFDSVKNMTIHGRPKGENKFTITVPAGKTDAILIKRNDETAASFHFKARVIKGTGGANGPAMRSNPM
jgi:hypothetical protein